MVQDEACLKLKKLIIEFENDCPEGPSTHSKIRFFYKYGIEFSPRSFSHVRRMSSDERSKFSKKFAKVDRLYRIFVSKWNPVRNRKNTIQMIAIIVLALLFCVTLFLLSQNLFKFFCFYVVICFLSPALGVPFFVVNSLIESKVEKYVYGKLR